MKRSNRLVLLIGIFLALVAFVLVVLMLQGGGGGGGGTAGPSAPPTTVQVVVAAQDINLGATIEEADVTLREIPAAERPSNAFGATALVVGQIARTPVTAGQLITTVTLGSTNGVVTNVTVPPGFVGMSIRVNQTSGVATLVKPGDFIDLVTGFTGPENVKLVIPDLDLTNDDVFVYETYPGDQFNETTVKAIAQGVQVLGSILPPPPTDANGQPVAGANNAVVLNDREQILVVSVPAQLAELVKFAQLEGDISIVLRSSEDCTTEPVDGLTYCPTVATTGITLRRVVDDFGVLPPTVVQVIQPTPLPGTVPNNIGPGGNN